MQWISLILALLPEEKTDWLQYIPIISVIGSLLGGGAMGAVIAALYNTYRNRTQPIVYSIELIEVFKKDSVYGSLQTLLTVIDVADSNVGLEVENLSVYRVVLINRGNQHIEKFKFGTSFPEGTSQAIEVRMETPTRYHIATCTNPPVVPNFQRELDFILEPFNKKDKYSFNIYFTYSERQGSLELSSPHPIKFVGVDYTRDVGDARLRWLALLLMALVAAGALLLFKVVH